LSPKFLHSNSTSHTWPFSAIAELIDNAYDPDVNAREFWIDKTVVQGQECLTFMDNGNGLTYELMHKMLSNDVGRFILNATLPCVREEHKASLEDILLYSPFRTVEELLQEVEAITSPPLAKTGTRIIIWNLRRTSTNTTEFDFETDRYDIRIPTEVSETLKDIRSQSSIPECFHSLRAYCSILYLKPRMQIIVRGQKVKTQLMAKSLALVQKDHYKPNFLPKRVPITFGYNTKSKEQYGVMMYHKNRLIKAYKRVGCQLKGNDKGVGVIGVIECNFLDPTHNKQSFIETEKYSKTIASLGIKLEDYWNEIRHKRTKENPNSIPVEDAEKSPDQNWVQCDECLKWRKLPDGINCSKLPDKWFCRLNPDPQFRDAGTSTDAGAVTVGTNTHTEKIRVKEEPQSQNEEEMIQKQVDHVGKSFCAVTRPFEGINADGSTRRSSPRLHVGEPQEGQVALYAAAQERDALKEQVQALTVQLQEAQDRLKELMESTVKKEYSHQFVQTEEGSDYKHLFVKVKQKIADLIKDNVSSVPTAQAQPRAQGEEGEFDEVVQPVEFLIQELKQRNKERDELCSQVSQTGDSYLESFNVEGVFRSA
ncbi:unnamed protein product, partial [Tetraodon nigroviridis]